MLEPISKTNLSILYLLYSENAFNLVKTNVIEIEGLLFPGFGPMRALHGKLVFPIKWCHEGAQIFQLKSSIFERPHDVIWWEKPVSHGARTFAKTQE